MKLRHLSVFHRGGGLWVILAMLVASFSPASVLAAPPSGPGTVTGTTVISFSSNPVTLVAGNDVTITTTTTTDPSYPALISAGKVTIEYASSGGVPVPAGTAGANWIALNSPGQNPNATGVTTLAVDLDALGAIPGMTIGFRAHYVTGGGSDKVGTHFSDLVDLGIASPSACAPGEVGQVLVGAGEASGVGVVPPGATGPWAFKITVKNCTTNYLGGVKVQGGSNGWAPVPKNCEADGVTAGGSEWCIHPSTGSYVVRQNKKNQVITWTLDMAADSIETILVRVNGTVPSKTSDGQIRYLSGAWSAVYDNDGNPATPSIKSQYSGRVSLCVDATSAPGDGDSLCEK